MTIPAFTAYLWLNCILLAGLLGFGWCAGCWLWAVLIGLVARWTKRGGE